MGGPGALGGGGGGGDQRGADGALWALYLSFVHVGQIFYGYGWEILLLETGFLAIFLCPLLDRRPFARRPPPLAGRDGSSAGSRSA